MEKERGLVPNVIVLAMLSLTVGAAQAEEKTTQLSKIVVTSQKEKTTQTNEIDVEELKRNLAGDIKDIFRSESSIEIGGGSRAAQRIYVRGIEASNLNVTIDGASQGMNHFQHRGNIGGIDPDLLKKVEVQTMLTADQGAGALGGSIRFETVDAQDLLTGDSRAGSIFRGGLSSVDSGDMFGGSVFGQLGEHAGILFNFSRSTFEEYEDGGGNEVVGSEGEDTSLFFKISFLEMAGHSVRSSFQSYKDEGLFTGDWTYGDGTARTPTRQTRERETLTFDHRFQPYNSKLIDWKFNAYRNESTLERNGETISDGHGLDVRNTARFAAGGTNHALTLGLDWGKTEGEEVGNKTQIDMENIGLYLQNHMNISRLMLSFGARFDDYETSFGNVDITGNDISTNVGAEVFLGWGLTGFASRGEAVRSKGVIPIGWLVDIVDNAAINQESDKDSFNKEMQPENSTTYEYGIRYSADGLVKMDDQFSAGLTFFDTEIENLIMQYGGWGGTPVSGLYNDDPITTKGFSAQLGWGLKGFKTTLSFTHAVTEDQDGKAIAFSRRKAASAGDTLVWDNFWNLNSTIGLGYTLKHVATLDRDDIDRDGYTLHNVQVMLTPSFLKGLVFYVAAHNLLDEEYSSHASSGEDDTATPEPGRDIRIGMNYKINF